ncbi:PilZ domain-containing protein [Leptospira sp. GIMC2001]|uniref:PilZ domain-containing protein n=1 Tax=Leptospira sp. GIMC2001 TaxID=1513297 RepID=UPI002349E726|nr:PilZ domain-containing protein [Leptospira sp. GIMC2001]WCL50886.1 PilZ domain-containing protein [Leptospira sp. GIMC2001]
MTLLQILLVLVSVIVSYGLLARKKFGYYTFLLFALILVLYNIWLVYSLFSGTFFHISGFPLSRQDILTNFALTLFLLGAIYYFLNQEVSAPYFSPESRGWRRNPRETIPIPFLAKMGERSWSGNSINVSDTGALIPSGEFDDLSEGDEGILTLRFEDKEGRDFLGSFPFIIVKINALSFFPGKTQIGIRFLSGDQAAESRKTLSEFLRERYTPRFAVNLEATIGRETNNDYKAIIGNVSSEGLYIISTEYFQNKESILVQIPTISGNIDIFGIISWTNPKGEFGKQQGFGVRILRVKNPIRFRFWLLKIRTQRLQTR